MTSKSGSTLAAFVLALVGGCVREPTAGLDNAKAHDAPGTRQAGPTLVSPALTAAPGGDAASPATPQQEPEPQPSGDERTPQPISLVADGAPRVTVSMAGVALIEVSMAERARRNADWNTVEVERRWRATEGGEEHVELDTFGRANPLPPGQAERRSLQTTYPGRTYHYRVRADGGEWSADASIRVPVPRQVPDKPSSIAARAATPFSTRVTWTADSSLAAGFEVQADRGNGFVRAALVDPTARAFVHHLLLPGQVVTYRVLSFNYKGVSEPSEEVRVTTPQQEQGRQLSVPPRGACVPQPIAPTSQEGGCSPMVDTMEGDGGRLLYNAPTPGESCRRRLIGTYQGCLREFGAFRLQADVVAVPNTSDDGWPILHAVAGAGQYVGAQIQTLRFVRGRYVLVDEAMICGDWSPDFDQLHTGMIQEQTRKSYPPFESCQLDGSL